MAEDEEIFELLIVTGGVDDDGVGGLSGVDERERRDIGERDRDLDEPDDDDFDDADDDDDGDRLIDVFFLCANGDDDDEDEARPAFAMSGRGAGNKVFKDNVLTVLGNFPMKRNFLRIVFFSRRRK